MKTFIYEVKTEDPFLFFQKKHPEIKINYYHISKIKNEYDSGSFSPTILKIKEMLNSNEKYNILILFVAENNIVKYVLLDKIEYLFLINSFQVRFTPSINVNDTWISLNMTDESELKNKFISNNNLKDQYELLENSKFIENVIKKYAFMVYLYELKHDDKNNSTFIGKFHKDIDPYGMDINVQCNYRVISYKDKHITLNFTLNRLLSAKKNKNDYYFLIAGLVLNENNYPYKLIMKLFEYNQIYSLINFDNGQMRFDLNVPFDEKKLEKRLEKNINDLTFIQKNIKLFEENKVFDMIEKKEDFIVKENKLNKFLK